MSRGPILDAVGHAGVPMGCRAPITSKPKQKFGAVSNGKRSIKLKVAVKDRCDGLSRARLTGHRISLTTGDYLVAKPRMSGIVSGVPTPMYFVGAAPIIDKILYRLSVDFTQESTKELEDQNDTFVIHPSSDSTTDLPQSDVSTFQPKRIIALTDDAFPPRDKTPLSMLRFTWTN